MGVSFQKLVSWLLLWVLVGCYGPSDIPRPSIGWPVSPKHPLRLLHQPQPQPTVPQTTWAKVASRKASTQSKHTTTTAPEGPAKCEGIIIIPRDGSATTKARTLFNANNNHRKCFWKQADNSNLNNFYLMELVCPRYSDAALFILSCFGKIQLSCC